jgi:hypothetical protein
MRFFKSEAEGRRLKIATKSSIQRREARQRQIHSVNSRARLNHGKPQILTVR